MTETGSWAKWRLDAKGGPAISWKLPNSGASSKTLGLEQLSGEKDSSGHDSNESMSYNSNEGNPKSDVSVEEKSRNQAESKASLNVSGNSDRGHPFAYFPSVVAGLRFTLWSSGVQNAQLRLNFFEEKVREASLRGGGPAEHEHFATHTTSRFSRTSFL